MNILLILALIYYKDLLFLQHSFPHRHFPKHFGWLNIFLGQNETVLGFVTPSEHIYPGYFAATKLTTLESLFFNIFLSNLEKILERLF